MQRLLCQLLDWLFAARGDSSAVLALAFTVNTWASSIDKVRQDAYAHVAGVVARRTGEIEDRHWFDQLENMPESDAKRSFQQRLGGLLDYLKSEKDRYSDENTRKRKLAKRAMRLSALLCALCILFQWYRNAAILLLFPYPAFVALTLLAMAWFRAKVRFLSWRVDRAFQKAVGSSAPDCGVPSVEDLRSKLTSISDIGPQA